MLNNYVEQMDKTMDSQPEVCVPLVVCDRLSKECAEGRYSSVYLLSIKFTFIAITYL